MKIILPVIAAALVAVSAPVFATDSSNAAVGSREKRADVNFDKAENTKVARDNKEMNKNQVPLKKFVEHEKKLDDGRRKERNLETQKSEQRAMDQRREAQQQQMRHQEMQRQEMQRQEMQRQEMQRRQAQQRYR